MTSAKRHFDRAIKKPEIQQLMHQFAVKNGWPVVEPYRKSDRNLEILKEIPGSFAAEKIPKNCPVGEARERAYYDLLPSLLLKGHEGKFIAFGYGRYWHALGKNYDEAMTKLTEKYRFQLPEIVIPISSERMLCKNVLQYFAWKLEQ